MAHWKGIVGKGFAPRDFEGYVASIRWTGWKPKFIVLHNTGSPTLRQWHDHPGEERMRNLAAYYRGLGWTAGPHLFVADDLIWVFTRLDVSGVHSPSWNRVSLGVEMVGDYDLEPLSPFVRDNTVAAIATLSAAAGLDSHSLKLHREDPLTTHTDCPGRNVDKRDLISRVHAEIERRRALRTA